MTHSASSPATRPFDVEAVRADFPALSMIVNGHPLTYLDNAASAQKPRQVLDRMRQAYESEYSNVHRGLHYLANAATEAFEAARESVRVFLNAASRDEIILSIMEHHSNIVPWHFLRERKGAVIRWAPVHEDGSFDLEAFKALLSPRTRIVAITQMSNVLGTVTPVKEIVRAAHAVGAKVLVDGCQGAVHMPVDVRDLDVDFYVVTGHKLYGPTGIGALYGKRDLLAEMAPYEGGGEMIREVSEDRVTYAAPPHRFEAGTPPIVQAIGLGAALDYMEIVGRPAIAAYEAELSDYAHQKLGALNSVRIIGTAAGKGAILSFELKGAHPHDVATVLDRYGVAVRAGTHCAQPLLARYGVTATCRASLSFYNTREDVDRLADALVKAQDLFA